MKNTQKILARFDPSLLRLNRKQQPSPLLASVTCANHKLKFRQL